MPKRYKSPRPGIAIPTQVAIDVATSGIAEVRAAGGEAAIAGGLAMQLLGYTRNTKDVDIIATVLPRMRSQIRPLSFGGSAFAVKHEWGTVELDIIVRSDDDADLYEAAATNAIRIGKHRVVSPDYMAVIKALAGRPKDDLDFDYLAGNKLVSRTAIRIIVRRHYGRAASHLLDDIEQAMAMAEWHAKNDRQK